MGQHTTPNSLAVRSAHLLVALLQDAVAKRRGARVHFNS